MMGKTGRNSEQFSKYGLGSVKIGPLMQSEWPINDQYLVWRAPYALLYIEMYGIPY